ncbi:flavin-containing monooxygenase [Agilicoccus flavus]|uniref:flavin-containing monooxygenase n=1 Tax=Agilicoccus flavus TaxID=2775968 RepID=UPI001CF6DC94|nr:NAD(P)/FAD-dependent oxidoreductase [Agilicoccus flavus]
MTDTVTDTTTHDPQATPGGEEVEEVDVLVIGAGMSGIDAAYRLGERRPGTSYLVLEAREAMGGTWDLFRYPGIRSDSDIFTFSYPFAPWTGTDVLADGASIKAYVERTARDAGIEPHIRFGVRVGAASWSSADQRWTVQATGPGGEPRTYRCRFLFSCAGYYDYENGHRPDFPGLSDYRGTFVHPQHWPDDLDATGTRVVVIGSGATAATVVPAMARTAGHVTMLQRTPTYMSTLPNSDPAADRIRALLPPRLAHRAVRAKNIVLTETFFRFARLFPEKFAAMLRAGLARDLDDATLDAHFVPPYKPWDQRVCRIPSGDLTKAIASGAADVVTDTIETFVPEGIRLTSGRVLEADVVVSATGLTMLAFGGMTLEVDGQPVDVGSRFAYRGLMLEGVPNFAFTVGYTNASWTLRSDLVSRHVCRLLADLDRRGLGSATPRPVPDAQRSDPRPLISFSSGYVLRAIDRFPKLTGRAPWNYRQSYLAESAGLALRGVRAGMSFEPARARTSPAHATSPTRPTRPNHPDHAEAIR